MMIMSSALGSCLVFADEVDLAQTIENLAGLLKKKCDGSYPATYFMYDPAVPPERAELAADMCHDAAKAMFGGS